MYIDLEAIEREPMRDEGSRRYLKSEIAHLISEIEQLREACQAGLVALELLRQWVGPPPTGPYDFDSLREDGWKTSTAAMKQIRAALTPKGEQQK